MKKFLIPILIVAILLGTVGVSFNGLVSLDEEVKNSWGQVRNVLKRRADLIPNLLETVKGYAEHEKEVLTEITEARSKMTAADTPEEYAEADQQLTSGLNNLNVVVEDYPDLKANENFKEFQAELASTENKIATERMRYNDAVKEYNTKIRRFPTNILAGMFDFHEREYFEIDEEDAEVPDVDF